MRQIVCICAVIAWCAMSVSAQKITIILYDGYTEVRTERNVRYTDQTQYYNSSSSSSCNCHECNSCSRTETCPSYQPCVQNNYSPNYASNDVGSFFAGMILGTLGTSVINGITYYSWRNRWVYPYQYNNIWYLNSLSYGY